jgi:glycosyltransferase involved in cell wall biosynthesis
MKISIVIPIHAAMPNGAFFLWRAIQSIMQQTYKNYEIVIVQEGTMPVNTNAGIKKSTGGIIKILYMDDYLSHPNVLKNIVDNFDENTHWLVTGCLHSDGSTEPNNPHYPRYNEKLYTGVNTIGSPSVLTIRRDGHLLFDENLSFLLDCDLYKRYYETYGEPKIINELDVVIGIHGGQTSNTMPQEEKLQEYNYVLKKYA